MQGSTDYKNENEPKARRAPGFNFAPAREGCMSEMAATELPGRVEDIARRSNVSLLLFLRWLGAWIDFAVLSLFLLAPDCLLGNELYQETVWIWLGALILYFPIVEGIWGRSLGKLITGTIVVDKAGRVPGIGKAVLRTLLRIIEVNPLLAGGIPAGVAVALSEKRQRLGDMLAQTYVVRVKDLAASPFGH
jgi:uncharacterized RDD family membrane protein YckC